MRISFDLDEVLFVDPSVIEAEEALRFPLNQVYKERLRKGTIALINKLQEEGFEVWVYTSSFRPEAYIKNLFRHYGIRFDDIVNAQRHLRDVQGSRAQTLPQKVPSHYRIGLHIDDEDVIIRNGRVMGCKVLKVCEYDPEWADKVLHEARRLRKIYDASPSR